MAEKTLVCCRLPRGYEFNFSSSDTSALKNVTVKLNGANTSERFKDGLGRIDTSKIILFEHDYGVTSVAKDIWDKIKELYGKDFPLFKNNTIFEAKNEKVLKDKAIDLARGKVKTGYEGLGKEAPGIVAANNKEEADE